MVTLAELNARMDTTLDRRVWFHQLRAKKKIGVKEYKGGLAEVRRLEDELEPQRKALGAKHSRAIERVTVNSDGYYEPEGDVSMSDENNELDLGAPPEPAPDPFAEVPADAGTEPEVAEGTLGGDGATLEELEAEQAGEPINGESGEFLEEPAEAAEPEPVAEEKPEPVESIEHAEPAPEAKPQPASEDAAAEPEKVEAKKSGSSTRHYAVLVKNPETGEWKEPFSEEGGIEAANGEIAMREAYTRLVPEDSEDQIEMVVFPTHYWKPKKVGAKAKVRRSVTIE